MDEVLNSLVFIVPGLLGYYMFQLLGMGPSQKHNVFEMLSLSTLLWFPVALICLGFYNIALDYKSILSMSDLQKSLGHTSFLTYYTVGSLVSSFISALILVPLLRLFVLFIINPIRKRIFEIAPYSKYTTVWEEIFHEKNVRVVEMQKIDKGKKDGEEENSLIGCIRKVSRGIELDRNVVLDDVEYFTELVRKHKPAVDRVFVDTKAGLVIKLFNIEQVKEMQREGFISFHPDQSVLQSRDQPSIT